MKYLTRLFLMIAAFGCSHAYGGDVRPDSASDSRVAVSQFETSGKSSVDVLRSKAKQNPKDLQIRLKLTDLLEDQMNGQNEFSLASEIIELLKPFNDRLPRKGLITLARAFGKKKDPISELRTLELCLAKNPNDYVVHTLLGDVHARSKRSDEAVAAYLESKRINKKYKPAYDGLLKELERTGDRYEARTLLNDMIKTFGPIPKFYTDLCRLFSEDNFLEKSVEICKKAIEMDPKTPENYVHLGASLKDQEESETASKILTDASKRFPASEPVQTAAGNLHAAKKDYVSAYKSFKAAVQANPKSASAQLGLAMSSFELQKYGEAMAAFSVACRVDKKAGTEFRVAMGRLRSRNDYAWLSKYENAVENCH